MRSSPFHVLQPIGTGAQAPVESFFDSREEHIQVTEGATVSDPEYDIVRHARERVDEEPQTGDHELTCDQAEKEGPRPLIQVWAPILEGHQLEQPGQKDAEPQLIHKPNHRYRIADGVQGPPQ